MPQSHSKSIELSKEVSAELQKYTPKQAAFYYWYSILGNGTKAALKVYYPDFPLTKDYTKLSEEEQMQYHTASTIARENLQKHSNPLGLYLDAHGMDFNAAIEKLKEGLEATTVIPAAILIDKNGNVINKDQVGAIEVNDYKERREWWDRFMRLIGADVSTPAKATTQVQVNNFISVADFAANIQKRTEAND